MRTCQHCGTELSDQAIFCHVCGTSENGHKDAKAPRILGRQFALPRTLLYVLMLALALMGLAVVGLAVRAPGVVTQTTYFTQIQLATISVSFTSSATMTATSTMTVASFSALSYSPPPPSWFNQQYCGYPFNPDVCNEGPPVTVTGYLTNDTPCVNLYVTTGQSYVVWNLPKTYPTGAYQVYGFIYPYWPQAQPFPPYPFQKTICVGTPMWAIPPYIQSA